MKKLSVLLIVLLVGGMLFAEGAKETAKVELPPGPAFDSQVVGPKDEGTVAPVANKSGKDYKIAILGLENNPFWKDVKKGALDAVDELAKVGVEAEWILPPGDAHTSNNFGTAIENCIIQEYDAIATIAGDEGLVPFIQKAVDAGIPVATFNVETSVENPRLFFVGADLYKQGVAAADYVNELLGGKGKVAIITGFFSVEGHEFRRLGFKDRLVELGSEIEIVAEVEDQDKGDIAYQQTNDFMSAHPDLNAVYVCAGGQFGAGKAIQDAGKAGEILLINYDYIDDTMQQIRDGVCTGTIGQDPYAQGHDPAIRLYNYLEAGVVPEAGKLLTRSDFVTKDNMAQFGF